MGWGQRKNTVVLMSAPGRKRTPALPPEFQFRRISPPLTSVGKVTLQSVSVLVRCSVIETRLESFTCQVR